MYSTDVEPDDDDDTGGMAENAAKSLRERRPTSTNKDELLELMHVTRNARRAWIAKKHPTITEIHTRYPRLLDMPQAVSKRFFKYIIECCLVTFLIVH